MIAALFVEPGGVYYGMPDVDPWDESRDARAYAGPWPVVFQVCNVCCRPKLCGDGGEFHARGNGRWRSTCKPCRSRTREREDPAANNARAKRWRTKNRDRSLTTKKQWHARNRDRVRAYFRLRDTGWTEAAFESAWLAQGGRCAICSVAMVRVWQKQNTVASDHDHATGKPRGLLCSRCNRAPGGFGDSSETLLRAASYLDRHR